MERDDEVQEYYEMSLSYLEAAQACISKGLYEPALANGIHALELAMKAALAASGQTNLKTHNVGGLFGRRFLGRIKTEKCRKINSLLTKYNLPRYPGQDELEEGDVEEAISFIDEVVRNEIPGILSYLRES